MSIRSELRAQALQRDGGCVWPDCDHEGPLEMAHIIPTGSGGRDELDAVAMLCKSAHDVLDARVSWKQARYRVWSLFDAYMWEAAATVTCLWPGCDQPKHGKGALCVWHVSVLNDPVVPGRTSEIRRLFAAYLGRDLYPPTQNDITKRKDG